MNTSQMTVAQITQLLAQPNVPPHIITMLKKDGRVSIKRLLERWRQRQQDKAKEIERVRKLYAYERTLAKQGLTIVAGIDEAGRGPIAGPVVTAAVILPLHCHIPLLNDSKKLTPKQREQVYESVKNNAIAYSHCVINIKEIDRLNIYQATKAGMYQCIARLKPQPQAVLVDAVPLPELTIPFTALVHGDSLSASIAAASIIAKVERDRIMDEYDSQYPMYGFSNHKGYLTHEHAQALKLYGPCPIHRTSFEPIKSWGAR